MFAIIMALTAMSAICCSPEKIEGGKSGNGIGDYAEGIIFVAPDGKQVNTGTKEKPLDIYSAVARVEPGETIYMRGGVYMLTQGVNLTRVATESKPVKLFAYEDEKPIFDCREQTVPNANNTGMRLQTAQWWHIKGLEIRNAYNSGFNISEASHIVLENCVAHHNGGSGFHMGYDHNHQGNIDGSKAAWITFLNCDAHNNYDWYAKGTNSDGFACKTRTGKGIRYIGCRAWSNSDDNWDFFECGFGVEVINCWAWNAGIMEDHMEMYADRTGGTLTVENWDGNGNGFKMGGGCRFIGGRDCQLESMGTHVFRGCIAFNNSFNGFDQNNHRYGAVIENCMTFNNLRDFNFFDPNVNQTSFVFRNNVTWGGTNPDRFDAVTISANEGNLWNLASKPADPAAEFVVLTPVAAAAPRQADGSLPTGFARLKDNSVLIDKGLPTQAIHLASDEISLPAIPYMGAAPDLGPNELK